MQQTERNKQVVAEFLRTFGEGHFKALSEAAEIWVAGSTAVSGWYDKAHLKDSFGKFKALTAEPFVVIPTSMVAEGDKVAVEAHSKVRLRDGRTFECSYHYSFRLADGKIVQFHEYLDTAYIERFFSASPPAGS